MEEKVQILTPEALEKEVQEIQKKNQENLSVAQVAELIKRNFFKITFDEVEYKLAKPSYEELSTLYDEVAMKKTSMLLEGKYIPVEVLKKKWKEKGIDLYEIEKEILLLQKEKEKYEYQLGKVLEEDSSLDDPNVPEKKIDNIKQQISTLNEKFYNYLDIALETRVHLFQYSFLTYLITRKNTGSQEQEKWEKAFNTYEEFTASSPVLINKLILYTTMMMKDELEQV